MIVVIDELPPPDADAATTPDVAPDEPRGPAPAKAPPRADDEAPLVTRLIAQDPHAFDQLVQTYTPRISRLAHRLLGWSASPADIDDLLQDVFLSILRAAPGFDRRATLSTWITAITLNHCRSLRRRLSVRLRAMTTLLTRARARRPWQDPADETPLRRDEAERVRAAVRRLKPADREVIVLHHLEHADAAAIANILGISKNAVEVRLHRARNRLRQLLQHE